MEHKDIVEYFLALGPKEQKSMVDKLLEHITYVATSVTETRQAQIAKTGLICPACKCKSIVGHGIYRQSKRYRCKDCNRTFSSVTGSAVSWIHKKALLKQYVYYMLQGYSLRKISTEMDICLKTAFDWRHKILKGLTIDENTRIAGVVEADETFFLFSEKGSKKMMGRKPRRRGGEASKKGINTDHVTVLTAYERKTGKCFNTVVCRGRITKNAIESGLGKWLDKSNSILCTDSHKSFEGFALDNKIEIKRTFVRRKEFVIDKLYHIQHVKNIHSGLKRWINKFNGVATKYLQNYMNYFNLVRTMGGSLNQAEGALNVILQKENVFIARNKIHQQYCIT